MGLVLRTVGAVGVGLDKRHSKIGADRKMRIMRYLMILRDLREGQLRRYMEGLCCMPDSDSLSSHCVGTILYDLRGLEDVNVNIWVHGSGWLCCMPVTYS